MSNLKRLMEEANKELDISTNKSEDGTVTDLGPAPTGHKLEPGKREPYHSLDIHDGADEDDGW